MLSETLGSTDFNIFWVKTPTGCLDEELAIPSPSLDEGPRYKEVGRLRVFLARDFL